MSKRLFVLPLAATAFVAGLALGPAAAQMTAQPPGYYQPPYYQQPHYTHHTQYHYPPQPYPGPGYYPPPAYYPQPQYQNPCCCPVSKRGLFTGLAVSPCYGAAYPQYPAYMPYPQYAPQPQVRVRWKVRSTRVHHRRSSKPRNPWVYGSWPSR